MTKAVYIGAGTDCIPLLMLDDIQEFIYIDCQPQTEYGTMEYESGRFYRPAFLPELCHILQALHFEPVKRSSSYFEYKSATGQVLKYYLSTAFPEMLNAEIKAEIESSDALILSGFDPHKCILSLMPNLKTIYCTDKTVYDDKEYEYETQKQASVFYELVQNKSAYTYTYKLIKQLQYFEYWNYRKIVPSINSLYTVESCDGLQNYYVDRPKTRTQKLFCR
jgi:hypothetical protein